MRWRLAVLVSIHAPTKGATLSGLFNPADNISFNPRSHEGSDDVEDCDRYVRGRFNPRSHEGSDVHIQHEPSQSVQFQSTLPRRERPSGASATGDSPKVSVHAPTKGATPPGQYKLLYLLSFNPRSHEGSDDNNHTEKRLLHCFNPRSHEGSDCMETYSRAVQSSFNPRSHEGSDRFHTALHKE